MPTQIRNAELTGLLETDFVGRNEPNYAWKSACSAVLALPGLRGFWPMSSVDENGAAMDISGQSRILTRNGNLLYTNVDLVPAVYSPAAPASYLTRLDEPGLDILGTEGYNAPGVRGLTIGGWFRPNVVGVQGLITKGVAGAAASSFELYLGGANNVTFRISNGVAYLGVASAAAVPTGSWSFIVGRFTPSTEVLCSINSVATTFVAGIYAALFNSAADFVIANFSGGGIPLTDGYSSLCWLSSMAIPSIITDTLFQQTRAMYNV